MVVMRIQQVQRQQQLKNVAVDHQAKQKQNTHTKSRNNRMKYIKESKGVYVLLPEKVGFNREGPYRVLRTHNDASDHLRSDRSDDSFYDIMKNLASFGGHYDVRYDIDGDGDIDMDDVREFEDAEGPAARLPSPDDPTYYQKRAAWEAQHPEIRAFRTAEAKKKPRKPKAQKKKTAAAKSVKRPKNTSVARMSEPVLFGEDAPPGAKYERMVKHIKGNHPTKKQIVIAYGTAWKNYNKKSHSEPTFTHGEKTYTYHPIKHTNKHGLTHHIKHGDKTYIGSVSGDVAHVVTGHNALGVPVLARWQIQNESLSHSQGKMLTKKELKKDLLKTGKTVEKIERFVEIGLKALGEGKYDNDDYDDDDNDVEQEVESGDKKSGSAAKKKKGDSSAAKYTIVYKKQKGPDPQFKVPTDDLKSYSKKKDFKGSPTEDEVDYDTPEDNDSPPDEMASHKLPSHKHSHFSDEESDKYDEMDRDSRDETKDDETKAPRNGKDVEHKPHDSKVAKDPDTGDPVENNNDDDGDTTEERPTFEDDKEGEETQGDSTSEEDDDDDTSGDSDVDGGEEEKEPEPKAKKKKSSKDRVKEIMAKKRGISPDDDSGDDDEDDDGGVEVDEDGEPVLKPESEEEEDEDSQPKIDPETGEPIESEEGEEPSYDENGNVVEPLTPEEEAESVEDEPTGEEEEVNFRPTMQSITVTQAGGV
jgi:hypothetical protein